MKNLEYFHNYINESNLQSSSIYIDILKGLGFKKKSKDGADLQEYVFHIRDPKQPKYGFGNSPDILYTFFQANSSKDPNYKYLFAIDEIKPFSTGSECSEKVSQNLIKFKNSLVNKNTANGGVSQTSSGRFLLVLKKDADKNLFGNIIKGLLNATQSCISNMAPYNRYSSISKIPIGFQDVAFTEDPTKLKKISPGDSNLFT